MSEADIGEWAVKQEGEQSVVLASRQGEIVANRGENKGSVQIWYIRADLEDYESMSWKVNSQDKDDLINRLIPEIINERMPTHNL